MYTTVLTVKDLHKITRRVGIDSLMRQLIDALEDAFRDYDPHETVVPVRAGFSYETPDPGLIEWMPVMHRGHSVTLKMVGYHAHNPTLHEVPTIISSVTIYDVDTGHLTGIVDGTFLTALRTGATSALAARYLASPQSKTVGLIGCGAQAVTQLHGLSTILDIEKVVAYDINPRAARSFVRRTEFLDIEVELVDASERDRLIADSDVVVTATSNPVGAEPVFDDVKTRPWLHINAVGSDFPGKVEVPYALLKRAYVVPDFPAQALKEGECQQLPPDEVGAPLHEIIRQPESYRRRKDSLTIFDSTGWAVADAVAANLLFENARQQDLGQRIEIEHIPMDPLDPYDFTS